MCCWPDTLLFKGISITIESVNFELLNEYIVIPHNSVLTKNGSRASYGYSRGPLKRLFCDRRYIVSLPESKLFPNSLLRSPFPGSIFP